MSNETLETEYRGHWLVYFGENHWGLRGSGSPIPIGPLDDVKKAIDRWECEKQSLSGISVWDLKHSDPEYWDKRCAVYFTPADDTPYRSRPAVVETQNGHGNPDSLYGMSLGDSAPDTPEVAAAIEAAKVAYEEAVAAGKRFKEARRAIPRLTAEHVASLPLSPRARG
jgi:hypothetical protein